MREAAVGLAVCSVHLYVYLMLAAAEVNNGKQQNTLSEAGGETGNQTNV